MNINYFTSIMNLNLWFKLQNSEPLSYANIPNIIPLRWIFIRDNWSKIKKNLEELVPSYSEPDEFANQIILFDNFIKLNRNKKENPLSDSSMLLKYFTIFNNLFIEGVGKTNQEINLIDAKISEIQLYNRKNFIKIREDLKKVRDEIGDNVGHTDTTYNEIYNRAPLSAQDVVSLASINKMKLMQDMINVCDFLIVSRTDDQDTGVDPFALAKINANNPNFDITTYHSGYFVRFPYGIDLQYLARQHFGDENKWLDIAIANGLKAPYIDELGVKIPLISNASGNIVNLNKYYNGISISDYLFIGQTLFVYSDIYKQLDQRTIINLTEVPISGEFVIELNGENDLDKYLLENNAYVHVFKPNTINSNFNILIPSTQSITKTNQDIPWFLSTKSETEKRAGVDLYVNDNGDLDFDATNDIDLSFGINNITQAVKLFLLTELGELKKHQNYGLFVTTGSTNKDSGDLRLALIQSLEGFVAGDDRMERIEKIEVEKIAGSTSSGFTIGMIIRLKTSQQLLPISFNIDS